MAKLKNDKSFTTRGLKWTLEKKSEKKFKIIQPKKFVKVQKKTYLSKSLIKGQGSFLVGSASKKAEPTYQTSTQGNNIDRFHKKLFVFYKFLFYLRSG